MSGRVSIESAAADPREAASSTGPSGTLVAEVTSTKISEEDPNPTAGFSLLLSPSSDVELQIGGQPISNSLIWNGGQVFDMIDSDHPTGEKGSFSLPKTNSIDRPDDVAEFLESLESVHSIVDVFDASFLHSLDAELLGSCSEDVHVENDAEQHQTVAAEQPRVGYSDEEQPSKGHSDAVVSGGSWTCDSSGSTIGKASGSVVVVPLPESQMSDPSASVIIISPPKISRSSEVTDTVGGKVVETKSFHHLCADTRGESNSSKSVSFKSAESNIETRKRKHETIRADAASPSSSTPVPKTRKTNSSKPNSKTPATSLRDSSQSRSTTAFKDPDRSKTIPDSSTESEGSVRLSNKLHLSEIAMLLKPKMVASFEDNPPMATSTPCLAASDVHDNTEPSEHPKEHSQDEKVSKICCPPSSIAAAIAPSQKVDKKFILDLILNGPNIAFRSHPLFQLLQEMHVTAQAFKEDPHSKRFQLLAILWPGDLNIIIRNFLQQNPPILLTYIRHHTKLSALWDSPTRPPNSEYATTIYCEDSVYTPCVERVFMDALSYSFDELQKLIAFKRTVQLQDN